jgi:hypothetical protein
VENRENIFDFVPDAQQVRATRELEGGCGFSGKDSERSWTHR